MALKAKRAYVYVTVPAGGVAGAMTIEESLIFRLTGAVAVSGGTDESLTVTEMAYVLAVAGVPESCPEALSVRPGGRELDAFQVKGGAPPEARKV